MEALKCDLCGNYSNGQEAGWYEIYRKGPLEMGGVWPKHLCSDRCAIDFFKARDFKRDEKQRVIAKV